MSFDILYTPANEITALFKTLSKFFDEIQLEVTPESLDIKGIDPSRVVLTNVHLPENIFDRYVVDGKHVIAINLHDAVRALNLAKSGDSVVFRAEDSHLVLGLLGSEKMYFHLPLLNDTDILDVDVPSLAWTAKAIVLAGGLKRALTAASLAWHSVMLKITDSTLVISSDGEKMKASTIMTLEDEALLDIDATQTAKSYFGITYLMDAIRHLDSNSEVKLKLGNTMPLLIEYRIKEEGYVKFLIAPRVVE